MSEPEYEIDAPLIEEVFRLTNSDERTALPRHRHDLTREQVETVQRARIIVATAEVVTDVGYAEASSKAIIDRAGVSSKTFYALFGDKESAFFAGFTLLDGPLVAIARNPPHPENPRQTTRDGIGAFLQQLAAAPLFARLRLVEGPGAGKRAMLREHEIFQEFVRAFVVVIEAAREKDPRITVPPNDVLMLLMGGIRTTIAHHLVEHSAETLPSLQPTIVESIERIVYGAVPELPGG
ncbi:MAG: TetR/AcrR family transcriptional regulator [Solirubrobacteraceae bacterium]|nr:TetR/AcrR family transcriptional regulator [Solirubrobacteraceae bacterium]